MPERARLRRKLRRLNKGIKPRTVYLQHSNTAKAKAFRISLRNYYRRLAAGTLYVGTGHVATILLSGTTAPVPRTAAPVERPSEEAFGEGRRGRATR